MLRNQAIRLLGQLAAIFVLAASFALPGVSYGSVVDQYTEIVPTPGGGRPSEPSLILAPGGPASALVANPALESESVVVDNVSTIPDSGQTGGQTASRVEARGQNTEASGGVSPESQAAPGGMGLFFPALLLLGVVASAGFVIGRRLGLPTGS